MSFSRNLKFHEDSINNRDDLKLSATDIYLVGCFLPILVSADLSGRCFLVIPIEHPQMDHPYTLPDSTDSSVSMKRIPKHKLT